MTQDFKTFYDTRADGKYIADGPQTSTDSHYYSKDLKNFINKYQLHALSCLEIGCGKGIFQALVEDYTGIDVSESLRRYHRKNYFKITGSRYLFADGHFDAVWSFSAMNIFLNCKKASLN